jgi:D-alanyl-lipoteichoic acid acyltransferase DltB (MBOAT superfamily)
VIFHSLDFVVFFLLTTAVYWRLPHRAQNLLLLAASYVFYGWVHPWFLSLIATTTIVDYWTARTMEDRPGRKRAMLGLSLAANLGLLGTFKYFNFFADSVQAALATVGFSVPLPALAVVLPVGISFYTFQELSYVIDVYRGTLRARRNFVDFALFVCFFPQLVAGPIERAGHLLPQVERPRAWSWPGAHDALFLIVWGYFKKLVIADNAGVIANKVFALDAPGFYVLWAGVFAFAIQIYGDFSAYSDIARGTARWLGFDLMRNFDHPYMARGPVEFWRRWHVSLSTWFRDYVYIPLGGSRRGPLVMYRNLFLTFVVSGLWHGANWNFVVWGAYHGALVVLSRLLTGRRAGRTEPRPRPFLVPFQVLGMFALTCVGWLIFRETDFSMLVRDLTLAPGDSSLEDWHVGMYLFVLTLVYSLPLWIDSVWSVYVRPYWEARATPAAGIGALAGRTALAGAAVALMLVFRSRQSLDFIYFQF